ncbi:MAG: protease pro-enzyme activation domain-containing protein [Bacillota bacterium]|nr:protease pro-enzyme activation domain-containing protein [Bacillota bacterium]
MFDQYLRGRALSCLVAVAAGLFVFTAWAFAQNQSDAIVPNRITQPINPDQRVTLQHNVHPLAQARFDRGAAPEAMPTGRLMLLLKHSSAQEIALKQFLSEVQDPSSPNYHKWLTPAQYGQRFGVSDADLNTVTAWLQSQGFTIDKVPQARNVVIFSGNVAQLEQAFHTSIHKYVVNGETHFANATDPQIPAALAPVVAGVGPLNDFHPKPGAILKAKAHYDTESKRIVPDLTLTDRSGNDYLFMAPADAATVYDTPNLQLNGNYNSKLLGGKSYDGSGVTIGIAGDSNINAQDVANYRAAFLPSTYSSKMPNVIVDGNDPGVNGDAIEALLDLEVAGGIAPGATINFYTSGDTDLQSGLFLAIYRALDDNQISILNVSFGACEYNQGSSGNQQILNAWEQAAAQGITVTVSSGDSGSAGCDNENTETQAQYGLAVNGLASTPYNIAVGGTDYNVLSSSFSAYVSSTNSASNYYRTALNYIPENPWNDSTRTNTGGYTMNSPLTYSNGNTNIVGGGGGPSNCSSITTQSNTPQCSGGYPVPSFQTGLSSSLNFTFNARTLPDVSFLAADSLYGALWLVCADSSITNHGSGADCQSNNGQLLPNSTFTGVGGTSAAAPAFAGMLALVAQSQGGARLGQADYVLYNLASQAGLYSSIFHDVSAGNNSVYCKTGSPNCGSNNFLTGYNAAVGYDAASGLGSVDVSQLVANWTKASFASSSTTLQMGTSSGSLSTSPTINVTHGTNLYFGVSVNPGSASGDVSINTNANETNSNTYNSDAIGLLTLQNGSATGSTNTLPGGTYKVYAYYGGDKNTAASTSNQIQVTISPENSATLLCANVYDALTGNPISSPVPYGSYMLLNAQPYGTSGNAPSCSNIGNTNGYATGSIVFLNNNVQIATEKINSNGFASYNNVYSQSASLPPGNYSITTNYSGDASFKASNGGPVTFTVTKGNTSVAVTPTSATISASGTVTLTAEVNTDSIGEFPTGSVTFTAGSTTLGTANFSKTGFANNTVAAVASFTVNGSQLTSGTNTITATYSGDTNYAGSGGTASVTVTGGGSGSASFGLSGPSGGITIASPGQSGSGTITITPANGFTGNVALSCSLTSSPSGATDLPSCSINSPVVISSSAAGTATLTVTTTAATSSLSYPLDRFFRSAGATALAFVVLLVVPARRRSWKNLLGLVLFAVVLSSVLGCGGSSNGGGGGGGGNPGTTAGTYTFTVTGTSGSITASTTVNVTVQ